MRAHRNRQVRVLTEYVRQHRIGPEIAGQARNWVDKENNSDSLREQLDVELRNFLPVGLMTEMRVEAWSPILIRNPLFNMMKQRHPRTECKLCYESLFEVHLIQGFTVFTTGDACSRMMFCVSGLCLYVQAQDRQSCLNLQKHNRRPSTNVEEVTVEPGIWLSEACLYTPWQHCGDLCSTTSGMHLAVGTEEFAAVVKQYEQAFVDVVIYARVFVADLNNHKRLSDLFQSSDTNVESESPAVDVAPAKKSEPRRFSTLSKVIPGPFQFFGVRSSAESSAASSLPSLERQPNSQSSFSSVKP